MRTYPRNSPEAAARIVALVMLADGHVDCVELQTLEHLDVDRQLELHPGQLQRVLHDVCEDLLVAWGGQWETACQVDASTLSTLLDELSDVNLQTTVLRLCTAMVDADGQVADCEDRLLQAARAQWQVEPLPGC